MTPADGRLDAEALYASTSAGVVDITAKGVSSGSTQPTPFGGAPQQPQSTATGTGFVIDRGRPHRHRVARRRRSLSITIRFEDGMTRTATLLGQDDATESRS